MASSSSPSSRDPPRCTPPFPLQALPLLLRPLLAFLRTSPGQLFYSLLVQGLTATSLLLQLPLRPFHFHLLSPPPSREHLAQTLASPSLGITHHYYVTNGIKLHVVTKGQQGAPLLLFLHGFPEFWYSWKEQLEHFSQRGFFCVAVDLRGYGDSEKPKGVASYTLEQVTADLQGLIPQLGYERAAAVVGHDWGAMIGYAFAARFPQLLERLMVMNGAHPLLFCRNVLLFPQIFRSIYVYALQLPLLPELLLRAGDYAFIRDSFLGKEAGIKREGGMPQESLELYKYAISRPGALTGTLNYYRNMLRPASLSSPWLSGKISTPTMVLWGREDAFGTLELNNGLEELVERLEFFLLDCGHWVPMERPEIISSFLEAFLKRALP